MNALSRFVCAWLLICMLPCGCMADDDVLDYLKPIWLNKLEERIENSQKQASEEEGAAAQKDAEPVVSCADTRFEVIRSAVYQENEYSPQAYVYAQLRNVSDEILCISQFNMEIQDEKGKKLASKEYADYAPGIVYPGEMVFVKEWLYDYVRDPGKVAGFALSAETRNYAHGDIVYIEHAAGYVHGDYLICEVHNASQDPLYEISGIAVLSDKEGKILDIMMESTYSGVGLGAQSSMLLRRRMEEHARMKAKLGAVCEAWAYYKTE